MRHSLDLAGRDERRPCAQAHGRRSAIGGDRSPGRDDPVSGRGDADSTLAELQAALAEKGHRFSVSAIWCFFARRRITLKKSAHAAEQDRPDILKRREDWFESQLDLDPERLGFIDETWASANMARRSGRAQRGQRLQASVPRGHWKTTTFVAGLRLDGLVAPLVFDGSINAQAFEAYVEQFLAPTLSPADIVVNGQFVQPQGAEGLRAD